MCISGAIITFLIYCVILFFIIIYCKFITAQVRRAHNQLLSPPITKHFIDIFLQTWCEYRTINFLIKEVIVQFTIAVISLIFAWRSRIRFQTSNYTSYWLRLRNYQELLKFVNCKLLIEMHFITTIYIIYIQ